MTKFKMNCTCGDVMTIDAGSREEAVSKLQAMMTPDAVAAHMKEKHSGEALMTVDEVHAGIAKNLQPA